ncbi:MAG: HEAT repeat domain-containing protein [Candidatus Eisenbacteria bacterium]|nr:HEAT repeat domain-containing protein [Candidatus Eisenbacteria bacterium]
MADERLPLSSTLRSLKMRDLEGQLSAIAELKREKSPKSLQTLLEFLCDESWFLREKAADALMEVGASVVPELLKLAQNSLWFTRACAARILGRAGSPECTARLVELFADRNRTVRDSALDAILELAAQDGGESLAISLVAIPPGMRETFLGSLRKANAPFAEKVVGMMQGRNPAQDGTAGVEQERESEIIDVRDIISRPGSDKPAQ